MSSESLSRPTILIVDDNADVLTAVRMLLGDNGYHVLTALTPEALPVLLHEQQIDLVLLDMNFRRDASSGKEGLVWLDRIQAITLEVPVVMITAYGDITLAVRSMKHGAADFVTKPWSNETLLQTISATLRRRHSRVVVPPADHEAFEALIGDSMQMRNLKEMIRKLAATDANVLILGENGTGKELVARAIHQMSTRADGPFVNVDLGALAPSIFESELFGHEKGAYTGVDTQRMGQLEVANGGTIFLEEIGNVEILQQQKLLMALQSQMMTRVGSTTGRPLDVRLISATHAPLEGMVREGTFRKDLLYRINTVELHLPPLRDRGDDIELLARYFLRRHAASYGRDTLSLSPQALAHLQFYRWPGNVRELDHVIERAVILAQEDTLTPADLLISSADPEASIDESLDLASSERDLIRRALSIHGGNITRAAEALGLSRKGLYRRIEKYGL